VKCSTINQQQIGGFMKNKTLSILTGLLIFAGLSHATALMGTTAALTIEATAESSGLYAVGSGSFSFTEPANGTVIGLADLTSFSFELHETAAYGWGIPTTTENFGMDKDNLLSFSFDTANMDSLVMSARTTFDVPLSRATTLTIQPGNAMFLYPEVAFIGGGYGPADPSSVSVVPEPVTLALCGLGLVGIWGARRRKA
jgi:hypothetical protein